MVLTLEDKKVVKRKLSTLKKRLELKLYLSSSIKSSQIFTRNLIEDIVDLSPELHLNVLPLPNGHISPILKIGEVVEFWGCLIDYMGKVLIDTIDLVSNANEALSEVNGCNLLETYIDPERAISVHIANMSISASLSSNKGIRSRIICITRELPIKRSHLPGVLPFSIINKNLHSLIVGLPNRERLEAFIDTFSRNGDSNELPSYMQCGRKFVFVWAHWCKHARECYNTLNSGHNIFSDKQIEVIKLNAEKDKELAIKLGVKTVPSLVVLDHGMVDRIIECKDVPEYIDSLIKL